jgi:lysophospholipase
MTFADSAKKFDRRAWPSGVAPQMKPMADGWPVRVFEQPSTAEQPRGSILFQGGRGDIIEKYLECFARWHADGWSVTAFDWRGQGGSGRVLADPRVGHISDFAIWVDDYTAFFEEWRATHPAPHIIMGHSMGGHLLLRSLAERRVRPDAAVLVAPMLGFDSGPLPKGLSAWLISMAVRFGKIEMPAWKANERPAPPWSSRQKYLTHDADRYADEIWWKNAKPELALGPPSFGWLDLANKSCAALAAPGVPEGIDLPILVIGTDGDQLVDPKAIRAVAARLPRCELKMFGKTVAHEILRELDAPRDEALAAIDAFLDKVTPAR